MMFLHTMTPDVIYYLNLDPITLRDLMGYINCEALDLPKQGIKVNSSNTGKEQP